MYSYEYPRPMVTVDMIVTREYNGLTQILLIERGRDPYSGSWALPGGFVEMNETLIESAYRELAEETHITELELQQFKTYGNLGRDPRGRTISVVYIGVLRSLQQAKAGDDAAKAQWFHLDTLPDLAFDHGEIVKEWKEKG